MNMVVVAKLWCFSCPKDHVQATMNVQLRYCDAKAMICFPTILDIFFIPSFTMAHNFKVILLTQLETFW